jgi:hypothetical protein
VDQPDWCRTEDEHVVMPESSIFAHRYLHHGTLQMVQE